ncbi:hypothetical protein [Halorubrum aethiopicum]|uniref:hypothetical protein n=1 Tax=Halorubrum aethiopicum TaxID=1758255 RepID=UPI00082EB1C3|nr:hypothetical protein [Halorubrum aethiopicum]
MAFSSLLDTVLAEEARNKELDAERDDGFQTWVKRLNQESRVLIKRADRLDFTDSSDRQRFNELIETMEDRFRTLREQDTIGEVPIAVVMELETLLDEFAEAPTSGAAVSRGTLGTPSPAKQVRNARRKKEREKRRAKRALDTADTIAEQVQAVYNALPNDE